MCLDLAFFFSPCFAGADGGSFTFAPPSGISLPSQGFKAGREALMPKEDELEPDLSTEVRRGTPHKAEPLLRAGTCRCLRKSPSFRFPVSQRLCFLPAQITISEESQRLERLTPFPSWDGKDITGLRVLIKVGWQLFAAGRSVAWHSADARSQTLYRFPGCWQVHDRQH